MWQDVHTFVRGWNKIWLTRSNCASCATWLITKIGKFVLHLANLTVCSVPRFESPHTGTCKLLVEYLKHKCVTWISDDKTCVLFFLYIFLILYWYKNCPIYYLFWCIHFGSCIRSIWNIWYWRRVVSPISDTVEPHWNHCRYLIHLLFCWPLSNCSGLVSCSCISHVFLYPEINPVTVISLHEIPMFNHPVKHVNKQSSHSDGRIIYTWNHLDKDLGFPLPDSHICCVH